MKLKEPIIEESSTDDLHLIKAHLRYSIPPLVKAGEVSMAQEVQDEIDLIDDELEWREVNFPTR